MLTEMFLIIDASKFRFQCLEEENYYIWSRRLELNLFGEGRWEIVKREEMAFLDNPSTKQSTPGTAPSTTSRAASTKPSATSNKVKTFEQGKDIALTTILFEGEDSGLSLVIGDRHSKSVYDKLKSMYRLENGKETELLGMPKIKLVVLENVE